MAVFPFGSSAPFATGTIGTVDRLNQGWTNSMSLIQADAILEAIRLQQVDITTVGTVNNHAPTKGTVIRCNNASALTITGIVPFGVSEIRVYQNIGTSTLRFTHQDAGSTAGNRIICPSVNGQLLGADGSIGFQYDGTASRWRIIFINPGRPVTPAFSAGDYTAASGTWTVDAGDVAVRTIQQVGKILRCEFRIHSTDISATPANLSTVLTSGFVAVAETHHLIETNDAGTFAVGVLYTVAASATLNIFKTPAGGNWTTTSSDNTGVAGKFDIEVQ